jgi:hypothetical protein
MDVNALVDATERALQRRGTATLSVSGDDRRWCAICVAVDESIELRVGEPSRGWRRWRPAPGEAWLLDHGFVHVIDAWAMPAPPGATPHMCAELLAAALRYGLGAPDDGELAELVLDPGLIGGDTYPVPPTAPHAEHIRHVVRALAEAGRGKVCIEGGRPAVTWAWVFAAEGELELSPEPVERDPEYSLDWTVDVDAPDLTAQADTLTALLHDDLGRSPADPLFVSFMAL